MITVILNGYKRGENLNEQMEALKNQTLPPDEILVWYNNPGDNDLINYDKLQDGGLKLELEDVYIWELVRLSIR